jgi:hypothetical protein
MGRERARLRRSRRNPSVILLRLPPRRFHTEDEELAEVQSVWSCPRSAMLPPDYHHPRAILRFLFYFLCTPPPSSFHTPFSIATLCIFFINVAGTSFRFSCCLSHRARLPYQIT